MVHHFDEIPDFLISWIPKQHVFWVASAPLTPDGHVNISPKGFEGTFHVVNSRRVWYEDLSGSGAETTAHLRENGRITILFNAFDGPPRICRLYGKGKVHEFGTPEYNALIPSGSRQAGSRSAIVVDVFKVAATCGYSVPYYSFVGHRTQLHDWAARKEAIDRTVETQGTSSALDAQDGLKAYWRKANLQSLDGLPAVLSAHESTDVFQSMPYDMYARPSQATALIQAPPQLTTKVKDFGKDTKHILSFFMGIVATITFSRLLSFFRANI